MQKASIMRNWLFYGNSYGKFVRYAVAEGMCISPVVFEVDDLLCYFCCNNFINFIYDFVSRSSTANINQLELSVTDMNSVRQPPNVKVTTVTQKSLEYEGQNIGFTFSRTLLTSYAALL